MPDAPVPNPEKTAAPVSSPGKNPAAPDSGPDKTDVPAPVPAKSSPLIIVFGVLSAVLFIIAMVFWIKVGVRDRTIAQIQNRADQIEANRASMRGAGG